MAMVPDIVKNMESYLEEEGTSRKRISKVYQPSKWEIQKNSCQLCNKTFNNYGGLSLHMKSVHDNSRFKVYRGNGKETFECQICQKDFTKTAKGLNSAMKFSTFNGLKNHFLILHKDSNFLACVCHVCYGSFRAHKLLRAHLKNVHNLNYGNISVPQNQAANDGIVDSSKIEGHNDKFLESIEWGSSSGVRQIPSISIEECQRANQLPQPGKQQQWAEKNQDLEKELNIQNHWQKEKQDPKNKEEIRKQTRHQWKKQRQEWKKWDPEKTTGAQKASSAREPSKH